MRILFDQGVPVPIAAYLREHTVRTALEEGWDTLANGDLLRVTEDAGFDVLLTTDTNSQRKSMAFGAANDPKDCGCH